MEEYDVVIVGAGPAGVTVASSLIDQGIRVLIIEKEKLPRCKICAGGFTKKSLSILSIPYEEQVKFTAKEVMISYRQKMVNIISGSKVLVKMFERKDFDFLYIHSLVGTKINIKDCVTLKKILYENTKFILRTEKETIECKYLVGADGVNSVVNHTFNIVDKNDYGFGVEVNCPLNSQSIGKYYMRFDFDRSIKGYFWIFPKDKYLCIGAYSSCKNVKGINKLLSNYISDLGLSYEENLRGHLIPFHGINYKQPKFPCILVGDAAGFGDRFTGEGIYYAIKSGQIAGEVIRSSFKNGYFDYKKLQKQYNKEIIRGLKIGYILGEFFYINLPLSYKFLQSSIVTRIFYEGFAKGYTYDQIVYNILSILWDIIMNKSNITKKKYRN